MTDPTQPLEVLPETKRELRSRLRSAPLDAASFLTPLRPCVLAQCSGICCHDGARLSPEEAQRLQRLVPLFSQELEELGLPLHRESDWLCMEQNRPSTRTVPCTYPPDAPKASHFPDTACVFRLPDARCALQTLAMQIGEHPWAFKPLNCWLRPISFQKEGRTVIWLPQRQCDPLARQGYPGFASHTPCGSPADEHAPPAYETLRPEL
ncbi:MAG: hypothetical protein SFY68_07125, partial [Candidatus Sumerlaeia bacterium]|nr:hypothetical protein [Candidatus Sumerlaeia bacterium]